MKKLCAIIIGLAIVSAFYACQKQPLGIFNPKQKLNKIYSEEDGHYLQEEWTWTGNLLSKIDYYRPDGNILSTHRYVYDGDRLARIESGGQYTEFLYEGKLLKTINSFSGDKLEEIYDLTFEKNKLSHISYKKPAKGVDGCGLLPQFLPGNGELAELLKQGNDTKAEIYNFSAAEIDFVWEGDNIQYMKMRLTRPDSIQRLTFTYIYDESLNPKNGFLSLYPVHTMLNDQPQYLFCSKNNVTSVSVTDFYDVFSKTKSFTYSYDCYNKYPTKVYSTYLNTGTMSEDSTLIYTYVYVY